MSRDKSKPQMNEENEKKDITFDALVTYTEAQIKTHQNKIKELRKSLVFFKKQASLGVPFPMPETTKQ